MFRARKTRRSSLRKRASHRRRAIFQSLEDRRLLAAFELSSLLEENGGDGSAGFVAYGPTSQTGDFVSLSSDINGDGFADALILDRTANPIDNPQGWKNEAIESAVYVVYGNAQGIPEIDLLSLDGINGFAIYGNPDDGPQHQISYRFTMVASGGDVNGDGVDDIVFSHPLAHAEGQTTYGRAYVLYGNQAWGSTEFPASFELQSLTSSHGGDGSQGFAITGSNVEDSSFAGSVAMDGDVNGDGINDLILGSQFSNDDAGQTVVVFGRHQFPAEISTSVLDGSNGLTINGIEATDFSGSTVSAGGDLNGDSIDDIVIAARRGTPDQQRINAGQVFVIYGDTSFPSTIELSDILADEDGTAGFVINGIRGDTDDETGDRAGTNVRSGGDFNGDGKIDLTIGASRASNDSGATEVGEVYVVYGRAAREDGEPAFLPIMELSQLDGVDGVTIRGVDEGDNLYQHGLVNFNGDGYADLVLAAPGGDPDGRIDAGEAYVVFGTADVPAGGVIDLAAIVAGDGSAGIVIHGIDAGDFAGGIIYSDTVTGIGIGAGDFNGDGLDDVMLGTGSNTPEAYVVFGGANIIPPPPSQSFSINNITVIEGDSGTLTAELTVTRTGDPNQTASVDYATADGTATTADGDYTAITTTTLTFFPGDTTLPISVTVSGDTTPEDDETFFVDLTNPTGDATIWDDRGLVTINDNEPPSPNVLYAWEITSETRNRGKKTDVQFVIDVNQDSNFDGLASDSDGGAANALVIYRLYDSNGDSVGSYFGLTDSEGILRTNWISKLPNDTYTAEVVDLALADFDWIQLPDLNGLFHDDADGNSLPDELFTIG